MYLYKYYGTFCEHLPDDNYKFVAKVSDGDEAINAVYLYLGYRPHYLRSAKVDESGAVYYDYGSHIDFFVLLPRPWDIF